MLFGMLTLPLWLLNDRHKTLDTSNACDDAQAMVAFTSTDQVAEFLKSHEAGRWQISLVSDRDSLVIALAEMHLTEDVSLCLDPDIDGSGGEKVELSELIKLCHSLKQPQGSASQKRSQQSA
jgi:hypothetical protein